MLKLKELLSEYSDQELVRQFTFFRDDYTEQAFELIRQEIEKRSLDPGKVKSEIEKTAEDSLKEKLCGYTPEEFTVIGVSFSRSDMLLINAILREHKVPFHIKDTVSDPSEGQAAGHFSLYVHNDSVNQAKDAIAEHFTSEGDCYKLKHTDTKERLKAFNFHDIHLDEKTAAEQVDVTFSSRETAVVAEFGKRLLDEADEVEQQQQRVLFYYDSIEPLLEKLKRAESKFCRTDFLAILEICQVYCEHQDFPDDTDELLSCLLSFFLS